MPQLLLVEERVKRCVSCQLVKTASEFRKAPWNKSGLHSYCKSCLSVKAKARRLVGKPIKEVETFDEGMTRCVKCKSVKTVDSFPERGDGHGTRKWCRDCNREYHREFRLKKDFGISQEDYEILLHGQNGKCAICQGIEEWVLPDGSTRPLVVDHCHKTGKVRGLLCAKCNSGIGMLGDSLETVQSAARYLETFN